MKIIRALWFSNVPSMDASKHLGKTPLNYAVWMNSLKDKIHGDPEVTLGIVFPSPTGKYEQFEINTVKYYGMPNLYRDGFISGKISGWFHEIEPETILEYYLKAIEDFKPDLIHIFGTERSQGLVIKKIKIPAVIHLQGNLTIITQKYFSGISKFETIVHGNKKDLLFGMGVYHDYFYFRKRAKRELRIYSKCKFFMGRTEMDRRLTQFLSNDSKYFHCEEVLREEFYSNEWKKNSGDKKIVFANMMPANYKGFETLCEAALLLKEKKKLDVELRVSGISEESELYKIVDRKLGKGSLKSFVTTLGYNIQAGKIVEEMLKSHLFVHPSHIENSPNSVCEAMVLGMPIVCTNVGGTSSIISDQKEGLLIQDGEPYTMAAAMYELFLNEELAGQYGSNARKRALERHNPEKVKRRVIEIYREITGYN
ncbi:MAG: glycosyltransferase [Ignavibacteriales bacterium]|nr:MAG: glycosyltransferase [Ignavibacteriales bacterium]